MQDHFCYWDQEGLIEKLDVGVLVHMVVLQERIERKMRSNPCKIV